MEQQIQMFVWLELKERQTNTSIVSLNSSDCTTQPKKVPISSFCGSWWQHQDLVGSSSSLLGGSLGTFSEVALETARHVSEVPHPPGSSGLAPDGLHTPVILADAGGGVAAGGAGALLEVEAPAAAADAERVRLVPALAEAPRTLALHSTTIDRLAHLIRARARGCAHES